MFNTTFEIMMPEKMMSVTATNSRLLSSELILTCPGSLLKKRRTTLTIHFQCSSRWTMMRGPEGDAQPFVNGLAGGVRIGRQQKAAEDRRIDQ